MFRDVHLALGQQLGQELPLQSTIACHVFIGETMMAKERRAKVEQAFCDLLRSLAQREMTLSNFVKSRGNSHKWMRSFLHELCRRMDLGYCTINEFCVVVLVGSSDERYYEQSRYCSSMTHKDYKYPPARKNCNLSAKHEGSQITTCHLFVRTVI